MFRTGIWRLDQLPAWQRGRGKKRYISCRLLGAAADYPAGVDLFAAVTPRLPMSTGAYRTTYRGRFGDVDACVNSLVAGIFPAATPLEIQDWAASDCLTASEWAQSLRELFPYCRFVASDIVLYLIEASRPGETYILEPDGAPVQYVRPPFVIPLTIHESPLLVVNRLLKMWAIRRAAFFRDLAGRCDWSGPGAEVFRFPPWELRKISLVHPGARALVEQSDRFEIRRHSVFEPLPAPCHVIRTMNIYNRHYFAGPDLLRGIRAVHDSLLDGGIWILGRTIEEGRRTNHATVFRKLTDRFEALHRIGNGSEIEDYVVPFRPAATGTLS